MNFLIRLLICSFFTLLFLQESHAQRAQVVDQIVAQVNDHIILKSDIDQNVFEIMRQANIREFDEQLWYDILESQIDKYVLIEKAKRDSIVVSDEQVNRQLDQRIRMLVQQAGSEQELERALGQPIAQIRNEYRELFREDILVQQVRQKRMQNISITRPEVIEFFNRIPTDSLPTIPESVELAHIVVNPPPSTEAREKARGKAVALRDSILHHNASLEDLARRYSSGPTASAGGQLPMLSTNDLLPAYSAAAAALSPGEISEVVNTVQGFHIIRLDERSGDQIRTSHILVPVEEEARDVEYARNKLAAIRDSVLVEGRSFNEMARRHSDDKATAPMGGRLSDPQTGQRRIPVEQLDPNLYRITLLLENEGDISQPRSFTPRGQNRETSYRIVQLRNRIPEHRANLEQDFDLIRQYALQFKQQEVLHHWMEELRAEVYIDYRVEIPERQAPQPDLDIQAPEIEVQPDQQPQPQPQPQAPIDPN